MVKTKREFIFGACVLSGIGTVLNLISLSTQEWISSSLKEDDPKLAFGTVKYGLFSGFLRTEFPGSQEYKLQMTCLMSENKCSLMSGSSDYRTKTLERIVEDKNINNSLICVSDAVSAEMLVLPSLLTRSSSSSPSSQDRLYINAGVLICTAIFITFSALLGLVSSGLAICNVTYNPVQAYLNIFGLYIYNGTACFTVFLTLVLWGSEYGTTLSENISCCWTLVLTLEQNTALGYSYWINIPSMFCYAGSIAALFLREYLINKEPTVNVHLEGEVDPGIYLY